MWLRIVHFFNFLYVLFAVVVGVLFVGELAINAVQRPDDRVQTIIRAFAASSSYFVLLVLTIVAIKICEAFLRVVPACIRYWIETTEERRKCLPQPE